MELALDCECGKQLIASDGMAGMSVPCECGRTVKVPSLGEMRARNKDAVEHERTSALAALEERQRLQAIFVYAVAIVWFALAAVPTSLALGSNVPTVIGLLMMFAGQIWLFALIASGNPLLGVVTMIVPVFGPLLSTQFIIQHWRLALWPVLCHGLGLVVFFMNVHR